MSQAGPTNSTTFVPPAGSVTQITPDQGPAIVPAGGNINLFGGSIADLLTPVFDTGITTVDVGASTGRIVLNNYLNTATTTADNTPNDTMTLALGATPGVYTFDINVAAFDTTNTQGAGFSLFGSMRTDGVNATTIGVPDKIINAEGTLAASDVNLVASGNNAVIEVTGLAATNINWRSVTFFTFVS